MQTDKIAHLLNYYTGNCLGFVPNKEQTDITIKVIEYLFDCGFESDTIIQVLDTQNNFEIGYFSFEMLPDFLWQNSLLEKDIYYIHHELHLNKSSNVIDIFSGNIIESNNAIEMKIQYTLEDVLSYFCKAFELDSNALDKKKEFGAIQHLLDSFKSYATELNNIDILLYLIDETSNNNIKCYNIFDMQNFVYPTIERLKNINNNLVFDKTNKIVWR